MLHLAVKPGTDMVLMNALFTHIADQGWMDKEFIDVHTALVPPEGEAADQSQMLPRKPSTRGQPAPLSTFADAVERNQTSLEEAAEITGLSVEDIETAARWIAEPKSDGGHRRTMFSYEKGLIRGCDNYRTNGALVNLALATGNVGRPGGGVVPARRPPGRLRSAR